VLATKAFASRSLAVVLECLVTASGTEGVALALASVAGSPVMA
jgi:hypothetical protein